MPSLDPDKLPTLFVRHAKAEGDHPAGDFHRGLTPDGRAQFRKHAKVLARQSRLFGIATSPLLRAVQTAEILAEAFGVTDVAVRTELAPAQGAARKIVELAQDLGPGWALVGHNPSLTVAACRALGLPKKEEAPFTLKKGAALSIKRDGRIFVFQWLLAPGQPLSTSLAG